MAKKEVASVYFQWENNLIKIQKSAIKCAFRPPKRSEASGNTRKCAVYL